MWNILPWTHRYFTKIEQLLQFIGVSHHCFMKKIIQSGCFCKCEYKSTTIFHHLRVCLHGTLLRRSVTQLLRNESAVPKQSTPTAVLYLTRKGPSLLPIWPSVCHLCQSVCQCVCVSGSLQLSETQIQLTISQMLHFPVCISRLTSPGAVSLMLALTVP